MAKRLKPNPDLPPDVDPVRCRLCGWVHFLDDSPRALADCKNCGAHPKNMKPSTGSGLLKCTLIPAVSRARYYEGREGETYELPNEETKW